MLLDKNSYLLAPGKTGPYAVVLVECHCHTVSCTAECYTEINLTFFHCLGKRMRHIGIVHTVFCVRTEVHCLIAFPLQISDDAVLVVDTGVIITYTYFHLCLFYICV